MAMSENEAIKVFKELLDVPCEMLVKYDSVATEEQKKALVRIRVAEDMAIQALEEIQAYRAIGLTPKMVKEMIESEKLASHQAIIRGVKLEQYESIGTIEEFKALKDKSIPVIHGKEELELHDKEIRSKVIDELVDAIQDGCKYIFDDSSGYVIKISEIEEIADQLKKGGAT